MRAKARKVNLFQGKHKTSHTKSPTSPAERSQKPGCLRDHSSERKSKSGRAGSRAHKPHLDCGVPSNSWSDPALTPHSLANIASRAAEPELQQMFTLSHDEGKV